MFFLFLLLLCTFAFLYMVTRRDVFLFFCIFFFFTFCTQVFLYMVRAKFVPFSSCILVFLYFELTFFFTFVFLYFCTYIDRVTRHKRGLFTSQDVIFPQPRCTQSCSPFHGNTSTYNLSKAIIWTYRECHTQVTISVSYEVVS